MFLPFFLLLKLFSGWLVSLCSGLLVCVLAHSLACLSAYLLVFCLLGSWHVCLLSSMTVGVLLRKYALPCVAFDLDRASPLELLRVLSAEYSQARFVCFCLRVCLLACFLRVVTRTRLALVESRLVFPDGADVGAVRIKSNGWRTTRVARLGK